MEPDGVVVVPEPAPGRDHVGGRRGGERGGGRPACEPRGVALDDAADLRLLEHDLGDEDRVRVARLAPRQDATGALYQPITESTNVASDIVMATRSYRPRTLLTRRRDDRSSTREAAQARTSQTVPIAGVRRPRVQPWRRAASVGCRGQPQARRRQRERQAPPGRSAAAARAMSLPRVVRYGLPGRSSLRLGRRCPIRARHRFAHPSDACGARSVRQSPTRPSGVCDGPRPGCGWSHRS